MTIIPYLNDNFLIEDGELVRKVTPRRGKPYAHRCAKDVYEQVAWAIQELGDKPFTLASLFEAEQLPHSQVAVALAFLRERSIIEVRRRKNYAATPSVHLDAMTEFHALAVNE